MDRRTQEAYFRQRVLAYAAMHGVTAAANRYHMSRKTVHKWRNRYDGTLESLKDRSRRPHYSPRKQSEEELELVKRLTRRYRGDRLLGYEMARNKGYSYAQVYPIFCVNSGPFRGDVKHSQTEYFEQAVICCMAVTLYSKKE